MIFMSTMYVELSNCPLELFGTNPVANAFCELHNLVAFFADLMIYLLMYITGML